MLKIMLLIVGILSGSISSSSIEYCSSCKEITFYTDESHDERQMVIDVDLDPVIDFMYDVDCFITDVVCSDPFIDALRQIDFLD